MPGLIQKIQRFLRSPQGQRMTEQARRYARDPENRAKAQDMLRRFRGGGGSRR